MTNAARTAAFLLSILTFATAGSLHAGVDADHSHLEELFADYLEWRQRDQVTEVSESGSRFGDPALKRRQDELAELRARFDRIDTTDWPVPMRVDHLAVRAQLDGAAFRHRVARPWSRDPGFWVDPLRRLAFTELPDGDRLPRELAAVGAWLALARQQLTEAAGEYADFALHNLARHDGVGHGHPYRETPPAGVIGWYGDLLERARERQPELVGPIEAALEEIREFEAWLRQARPTMSAQAGVGGAAFDWYLRHVKLMPYTADEVLVLAERELDRLRAMLALERTRNNDLPALSLPDSRDQYRERVQRTDRRIRDFIRRTGFVTIPEFVPDDFDEMGYNVPWIVRPGGPNYWEQVQYRDPSPDHWHAVIPGHRFDSMLAARIEHPIRRHIADPGRVEGWAMYLEEVPLQLGFYDDRPRVRELIYNFGIFRAVRTIGDIHLQRNRWNANEAAEFWKRHTPFLDDDVARVDAEIYLRRPPGYGISYTVGAFQLQELLADRGEQLGDDFELGRFHDWLMTAGRLPIALLRWELTGRSDEADALRQRAPLETVVEFEVEAPDLR